MSDHQDRSAVASRPCRAHNEPADLIGGEWFCRRWTRESPCDVPSAERADQAGEYLHGAHVIIEQAFIDETDMGIEIDGHGFATRVLDDLAAAGWHLFTYEDAEKLLTRCARGVHPMSGAESAWTKSAWCAKCLRQIVFEKVFGWLHDDGPAPDHRAVPLREGESR